MKLGGNEMRTDERLHEVRNSLSGIAAAADLLRTHGEIPAHKTNALLEMIASEAARLERLVAKRAQSGPADVSVDEVLYPVVLSRRVAGQRVDWRPCGYRLFADPDAISECLNILLVNAEQHAVGSRVRVSVEVSGDSLRIQVSDDGPGVAAGLGEALFTRGVRGPRSGGEGLGLNIARQLMVAQGGSIRLVNTPDHHGATFEIVVPARVLEPAA